MLALLAKLMDWSALQILTMRMRPANGQSPRLEEALKFLEGPDFIPAESQPARVEFDGRLNFRFPTPRPCEFVQNNLVYGKLYRCTERWRERPVIILLHGGGDSFGYRFRYPLIARKCNRAGFNAALLVAPYHFQRQPGTLSYPDYLRESEATAQAVAEIRALTEWLLGEGCPAVALWGYSFGGWLAGLTVCRDARLAAVVLTAPRVRIKCSFAELLLRPSIREALQRQHEALKRLNLTSLNLNSAQPVIPKEDILLIEAIHDLFVGGEPIEELWQTWGRTDIWRLPHGHVSKALLPGLTGRVLRWLAPRLNAPTLRTTPSACSNKQVAACLF
jgi:pimeloyl-ACP methyl ester carboxylesterase